ncbi:MAG: VWA domain-containing protein [Chloroflexota bacterium]|nr:VWA domain-containing protein [Chloroflexota bacterium]
MDGFRFETPAALLLLVVVPVLWLYLQRRRDPATTFGFIAGGAVAPRTWRVRAQPLLLALRLLAVALLILAIARPQHGEATTVSEGNGIDIVLAFDISTSMSLPFARGQTRLAAAKSVLSSFVEGRQNDRVGLVVFQGSTLTLSPLTTDYDAIAKDIDGVDRIRLQDGTAIGVAIGESASVMRNSTAASRVVILLTDGENNVQQLEPLAAARIAETLGVRVYTVGVVTRGSNPLGPALGVDEQSLRAIADVTHATYNRAEDPAALQQIYDQIDRLEKSRFQDRILTRFDDIAPYFLAAAVAALVAETSLRNSLLRRLA